LLDQSQVDQLRATLADRFTPEELIELLNVTTEDVFDRFVDQCLELDLEEIL